MKTMTLLFISGALLLTIAAPVNAQEAGYHEYDQRDRYSYSNKRRTEMPRWLKRQREFRHWYRRSPYKRRRALSWARVFEIYRWERRYARRYAERRYDHRDDDRRRNEWMLRRGDW
jgi:hypothetical protein